MIPHKVDPASPWQGISARNKSSLQLLYPVEISLSTPCIGGWLGLRVVKEMVGKKKESAHSKNRTPVVHFQAGHFTELSRFFLI
jgi:hypothetical protein